MYALLFQICCPMLGDRYMCKKRADVEKMWIINAGTLVSVNFTWINCWYGNSSLRHRLLPFNLCGTYVIRKGESISFCSLAGSTETHYILLSRAVLFWFWLNLLCGHHLHWSARLFSPHSNFRINLIFHQPLHALYFFPTEMEIKIRFRLCCCSSRTASIIIAILYMVC